MTWEEALKAMQEGKRLKHEYFCEDEWFEIQNGHLVAEDGCPMQGWYTGETWQKTGWSIVGR